MCVFGSDGISVTPVGFFFFFLSFSSADRCWTRTTTVRSQCQQSRSTNTTLPSFPCKTPNWTRLESDTIKVKERRVDNSCIRIHQNKNKKEQIKRKGGGNPSIQTFVSFRSSQENEASCLCTNCEVKFE